MNINGNAITLLKCMGLFKGTVKPVSLEKSKKLFKIAVMNKVGLFFLESLANLYGTGWFEPRLEEFREKHKKTCDLIAYVADLFDSQVDYLLFKTLKPFPYTPSDIDVLFHTKTDFCRAYKMLRKNGLSTLERDSYGMTLYSRYHALNVDLHLFPAVSELPYLNTEVLFRYTRTIKFGSCRLRTLKPVAEFLVVAAHSFYKEHMFNLSDFYTLSSLSQQVESTEIRYLAEVCKVSDAVYATVKLCRLIMEGAFGNADPVLLRLENRVNTSSLMHPISKIVKLDNIPYKFPKSLVVQGLIRKIMNDSFTRSFIVPTLARNIRGRRIIKLRMHFSRKSY